MSEQRPDAGSPFDPFHVTDEEEEEKKLEAMALTAVDVLADDDDDEEEEEEDVVTQEPSVAASRTKSPTEAPSLSLQPSDSSSLDPFGIGELTQQQNDKPKASPVATTGMARITTETSQAARSEATGVFALPPKMLIKVTIYEEVTSVAKVSDPGTSRISVEGSVYVQLHSSDARRNAPFQLIPVDTDSPVTLKPNPKYTTRQSSNAMTITVPKQELGYVPVLYYSMDQAVDQMPVLLERKVTIHEDSCRIAFQVRTKLTNQGDLRDFTLAVAIPEKVDADSIQILRGDGVYDSLKRLIKYKLAYLVKGESFMVSAQAKLWKALGDDEAIHFPVVMRCTSREDQITAMDFSVVEAAEQPSSLTVHKAQSFRLLHRLS